MKRQFAFGILFAASVALTACQGKYENTAIVKTFKASGGGDPQTASVDGIAQFLHNHDELENKLQAPCNAIRATADSDWPQSTEGKICIAVANAAFFRPQQGPDTSDKSVY